ncbi:hypothetical protein EVG20_g10737 [Dentipellis fragilis]|uniref:DUF6535 domain-containing protein n=1 Tax=Dentipellis fragilis TaxID=205917 RepID=A0A4Y9XPJ4_9AGAM|nr:hypothetical protein EVG20_g10737 [Dentipellis fragilis]
MLMRTYNLSLSVRIQEEESPIGDTGERRPPSCPPVYAPTLFCLVVSTLRLPAVLHPLSCDLSAIPRTGHPAAPEYGSGAGDLGGGYALEEDYEHHLRPSDCWIACNPRTDMPKSCSSHHTEVHGIQVSSRGCVVARLLVESQVHLRCWTRLKIVTAVWTSTARCIIVQTSDIRSWAYNQFACIKTTQLQYLHEPPQGFNLEIESITACWADLRRRSNESPLGLGLGTARRVLRAASIHCVKNGYKQPRTAGASVKYAFTVNLALCILIDFKPPSPIMPMIEEVDDPENSNEALARSSPSGLDGAGAASQTVVFLGNNDPSMASTPRSNGDDAVPATMIVSGAGITGQPSHVTKPALHSGCNHLSEGQHDPPGLSQPLKHNIESNNNGDNNQDRKARDEPSAMVQNSEESGQKKKHVFGVPRYPHNIQYNNPDDYEQKYPPDEVFKTLDSNARVWKVYLDEAKMVDDDMVEAWRDTIDVLLVFAGLFSAVVTTFVVQSSQALQPDYSQVSAVLLTELVGLQRAAANGASADTVPMSAQNASSGFHVARSDQNEWPFNSEAFDNLDQFLTTCKDFPEVLKKPGPWEEILLEHTALAQLDQRKHWWQLCGKLEDAGDAV